MAGILFLVCFTQYGLTESPSSKYASLNQGLTTFPTNIDKENVFNVNLRNNCIATIPDGTFDDFLELRVLTMSDNLLTEFPNVTVTGHTLRSVWLKGNLITVLPSEVMRTLVNVHTLAISSNNISVINNLKYLVRLETVSCTTSL